MARLTNDQRLTKSLQLKISNLRAEAAHLVTLAGEREKQANQLQALIDEVRGVGPALTPIATSEGSVKQRRKRTTKTAESVPEPPPVDPASETEPKDNEAPGRAPNVGVLDDLAPEEVDRLAPV